MEKVNYCKLLLSYIKMGETTYYQRNREAVLTRAKDYYENNKEVLREKATNKHRELSEDRKNIKREYGRNKHKIYRKKRNKD